MSIARSAVNYTNVICIGNKSRRNAQKKEKYNATLRATYVEETIQMYVCIALALV